MHANEGLASGASIVGFSRWLQTPPGRYLLAWEQAQVDAAVNDVFGFHALQLGLPELEGLRANRMPHRWLALSQAHAWGADCPAVAAPSAEPTDAQGPMSVMSLDGVALRCEFDALPLDSASLDLVLLPHALEQAVDPHHTLREVERVLRPEGRVVITGLNPASLWGLRQNLGRTLGRTSDRLGRSSDGTLFLPREGEFIGYWRLRDWLRLLSFDVELARFGCYCPPWQTETWLQRWAWMETVGQRWWTVLGAVYIIVAVKRVHGMRLVGLTRQGRRAAVASPAVALRGHSRQHQQEHP